MIKMSKKTSSLQELFAITDSTIASTGKRLKDHMDLRAGETNATVATAGRRLKDHIDRRAGETNATVATAAVRLKGHMERQATEIKDRSDSNHAETQRVIREEGIRTRSAIRDEVSPGVILFGIIMGLIAGLGMYFAERSAIFKPVAWDAATGAVTKYAPDTFMIIVLSIFLFFATFFIVTWITHEIVKRFR